MTKPDMIGAVQEGLYDMKVAVVITPIGKIKQEEHVWLHIAGEYIGEYPTYTQACEEVIRLVNDNL